MISTFSASPDIGVAIDVCHGDMPGVNAGETFELGKGPAIAVGPNIHPLLAENAAGGEGTGYSCQCGSYPGGACANRCAVDTGYTGGRTLVPSFPFL